MQNIPAGLKQFFGKSIHIPRYVYVLLAILLVAFDLRMQSVVNSVVDTPIRADALEYVLYAHNLKNYGIYSSSDTLTTDGQTNPVPDAKRAPLYPLFISLFLDEQPTSHNFAAITWIQAVISTFTVLMVFWISRRLLPMPLALTASALTAISPHLVTMNIYILSETLFSFLVVLTMLLVATTTEKSGAVKQVLVGLALGAAALTHPMLLYFVIPLAIFLLNHWGWKPGWKKVALVVMGFSLLYGAWIARNINTLGAPGDNTLMLAGLRTGVYANMMYQNDPQSYGYPYRFDPRFAESSKDLPSVVTEIGNAFRESPLEQLRWYILGKPLTLWSWSNIEGPGDFFVYSVLSTPYRYLPQFKATHVLMQATHWIFVALMAGGICLAWLPPRWSGFSGDTLFVARVISILLLYHAAVMMAGFPLPRYAVPMRPFLHILSLLPIALAARWILEKRPVQARPG